jgi:hypothetical protein
MSFLDFEIITVGSEASETIYLEVRFIWNSVGE